MKKKLVFVLLLISICLGYGQNLIIIDQDYQEALKKAKIENKLIFIDFYTTWCSPCKELDKLIFQNDSIKGLLGQEFILLKYDAENDTIHNLSKKHHVSSYPTAIILNENGYVVNRKYGFQGENFESLSKSVFEFTNEGLLLNKSNKAVKGYSNKIDISKYPKFYVDFLNRDNIRVKDTEEYNEYWLSSQDPLSEEYFSTLFYFGKDLPSFVVDTTLNYKDKYFELYGETDTEILFYFLTCGKFALAVSNKSEKEFNDAIVYAKKALSKEWTDDIIPMFEMSFLKTQNRWNEVYSFYENKNLKGEMSNGEINHFCWDVYKSCNDSQVIGKCMEWMKEITDLEFKFDYLDTYAFLTYKSGNKQETKRIAKLALEAAKTEGRKTQNIEALMEKVK